jgi:hypothetical protein
MWSVRLVMVHNSWSWHAMAGSKATPAPGLPSDLSRDGEAVTRGTERNQHRHIREHTFMHEWKRTKGWSIIALALLLVMSCTSMAVAGTAGEFIDDAVTTTRVKSTFAADGIVSALDISVETNEGVVNLEGIVGTQQERQRAIELASQIDGVKKVDARNLRVKR